MLKKKSTQKEWRPLACNVCGEGGCTREIQYHCIPVYQNEPIYTMTCNMIFCRICWGVYFKYKSGVFIEMDHHLSPYVIYEGHTLQFWVTDDDKPENVFSGLEFNIKLFNRVKETAVRRELVTKLGYDNESWFSVLPHEVTLYIRSLIM